MPVKLAVCGLLVALSLTVIVPVRVPDAVGVKSTLMSQLIPAAREVPQVSVAAKSPLAVMLEMVRFVAPVLDNVSVCERLVVPTV